MVNRKDVIRYLAVVFIITYGLNLILFLQDRSLTSVTAVVMLAGQMLVPALIAVLMIVKNKERLKDYGFTFGGLRYYILALLLIIGYQLVFVLVAAALGLGQLYPLEEAFARIGPLADQPVWLIVVFIFIVAPVQNLFFGFGEEFGWRGYLAGKMLPGGLFKTIVVVGAIWGLWHAPVILMGHNFPEHPVLGVFVMMLSCIPMGAVLLWLRLKSGSAVVAGFAHGALNATVFLGGVFVPTSALIFSNPLGLLGFFLLTILAFLLYRFFPVQIAGALRQQ